MSPPASTPSAPGTAPGLRANALGLVDVIGQSVANIGPSLTPAINIAIIAGWAGDGSWLSFAVGESASAPGQIPIGDLVTVYDIIRRARGGEMLGDRTCERLEVGVGKSLAASRLARALARVDARLR